MKRFILTGTAEFVSLYSPAMFHEFPESPARVKKYSITLHSFSAEFPDGYDGEAREAAEKCLSDTRKITLPEGEFEAITISSMHKIPVLGVTAGYLEWCDKLNFERDAFMSAKKVDVVVSPRLVRSHDIEKHILTMSAVWFLERIPMPGPGDIWNMANSDDIAKARRAFK